MPRARAVEPGFCQCGSMLEEFAGVCPECSPSASSVMPTVLHQGSNLGGVTLHPASLTGIQTHGGPSRRTTMASLESYVADLTPPDDLDSPRVRTRAGEVLHAAVGLLGLEVHEKSRPWAEAWLAFRDSCKAPGAARGQPGTTPSEQAGRQLEWQERVLGRLREVLSRGSVASRKAAVKGSLDEGPDFQEHLEVAEHVLKRITHSVGALQGSEAADGNVALREYTGRMVGEVCQDLRQWLEQLATLLSLYHVHLLDLETERQRLDGLLQAERCQRTSGEAERAKAVQRYELLQAQWKEDKMKQRASALLGIVVTSDDDPLIYSQRDVDQMMLEWEKENLEPLQDRINELMQAQNQLKAKFRSKSEECHSLKRVSRQPSLELFELGGMNTEAMGALGDGLQGLADRSRDGRTAGALTRMSLCLKGGASDLNEVLQEITQSFGTQSRPLTAEEESLQESRKGRRLSVVIDEMRKFEDRLKVAPQSLGAHKFMPLISWSIRTLDTANSDRGSSSLADGAEEQDKPPHWELAYSGHSPVKSIGVGCQLGPAGAQGEGDLESELRRRMEKLQQRLAAQLQEAKEQGKAERAELEAAMEDLKAQLEKARRYASLMREKFQALEKLMRAKGLGAQIDDAFNRLGIHNIVSDEPSAVFGRLYQDALDRMHRAAERSIQHLQQTSAAAQAIFESMHEPTPVVSRRQSTASVSWGKETTWSADKAPAARAGTQDDTGSTFATVADQHQERVGHWQVSESTGKQVQTCPGFFKGCEHQGGQPMGGVLKAGHLYEAQSYKWVAKGEPVDLRIGGIAKGRPATQGRPSQKGSLPPIMAKLLAVQADAKAQQLSETRAMLTVEQIPLHGVGHCDSSGPTTSRTEPQPEPRPERTSGGSPPNAGKVSSSGHPRNSNKLPRLLRGQGAVSMPVLGRPQRLLVQDVPTRL